MRRFVSAAAVVVLLTATGCGGAVGQPAGRVTLKGQPVGGAELKFVGSGEGVTEFFGQSAADGVYAVSYREFTGLPAGKYTVTVTSYTLRNGAPLPAGEAGSALKNDPTKSVKRVVTFERDIKAGANPIDFELSDGKAAKPN